MEQVEYQVETKPFSSREFRTALSTFATGVTVITSEGIDQPYGLTANAFSSVSLDPPLVLICIVNGTTACQTIKRNGVFAINILSADQEPLSRYFASRDRPRGLDAFHQVPHYRAVTGSPILEGIAAYLDCRLVASHMVGDHTIYIGEVLTLGIDQEVRPLLFHNGH